MENNNAAYGGCEANTKEEVQQIKVVQGVSFAEATKEVPRPVAIETISLKDGTKGVRECAKCDKLKEDTLMVSKGDSVPFMADIINCSAQSSSRTKIIEIILKSAEKYLDEKGMPWKRIK